MLTDMDKAKSLIRSPYFRFTAIAALCLGGAALARFLLIDLPRSQAQEIANEGAVQIELMAEFLEEQTPEFHKDLPELLDWFPAPLPCGLSTTVPADDQWNALGLKSGESTRFQYRLHKEKNRVVLLARRDTDCDGLHVVHRIEVKPGSATDVSSHNISE